MRRAGGLHTYVFRQFRPNLSQGWPRTRFGRRPPLTVIWLGRSCHFTNKAWPLTERIDNIVVFPALCKPRYAGISQNSSKTPLARMLPSSFRLLLTVASCYHHACVLVCCVCVFLLRCFLCCVFNVSVSVSTVASTLMSSRPFYFVFRGCLYICCPSDCRLVLYIVVHQIGSSGALHFDSF